MYSLKRRAVISAIIFAYALTSFIFNNFSLLQAANQSNQAQLIVSVTYHVINLLVGAVISILFLSMESIINFFIRHSNRPLYALTYLKEHGISSTLSRLEYLDTKNNSRIVNSIIFQSVVVIILLYAGLSSNVIVGKVLIGSLAAQLAYEQFLQLMYAKDLQGWFWQVGRVTKRVQSIVIFIMCLLSALGISMLF